MNEIEKAIKAFGIALEAPLAEHLSIPGYAIIEPAVLTALAALREQAEREKGCKYCNSDMCFTCIKQLDYYGDGSFKSKCADEADALRCVAYKPMKYCPMCGKRLEVEHGE